VDFPINSQNFIGRVKFVVPEVGILFIPPINYILLAGVVSAVGLTIYIYGRRKTA
jgi:hypothetical protein